MFGPCLLSIFRSFPYQGTCRGSLHLKSSTKITYGFDDDVLNVVAVPLLGAFEKKLRKATIALSCPSVRMEQLGSSRWTDFHGNLIFENFSKTCLEDLCSLKSDRSNECLT